MQGQEYEIVLKEESKRLLAAKARGLGVGEDICNTSSQNSRQALRRGST